MCGSRMPSRLRFGPLRIIRRRVIACSTLLIERCLLGREPRLRSKPDRSVDRPVPVVAAPTLDDFEEEAILECLGIDLQILTVSIPVIEDVVILKSRDSLPWQIRLGLQIVVIVLRD